MKTFIEWMEEKDPEVAEAFLGFGKKKQEPKKTVRWTPQKKQQQPQQAQKAHAGQAKWVDVKGQPAVG